MKKSSPKSLRKPSGKKQGTQNGHKGNGFSIIQSPDDLIDHIPTKCTGCPNAGRRTILILPFLKSVIRKERMK